MSTTAAPVYPSERAHEGYEAVRTGQTSVAIVERARNWEGTPPRDLLIASKPSLDGEVAELEARTATACGTITLAGVILVGVVAGVAGAATGGGFFPAATMGAAAAGIAVPLLGAGATFERSGQAYGTKTAATRVAALVDAIRRTLFGSGREWPDYSQAFKVPNRGASNRLPLIEFAPSYYANTSGQVMDVIQAVMNNKHGAVTIPKVADTKFRIKNEDIIITNLHFYDANLERRADEVATKTFLLAAGTTALTGAATAALCAIFDVAPVLDGLVAGLATGAVAVPIAQIVKSANKP